MWTVQLDSNPLALLEARLAQVAYRTVMKGGWTAEGDLDAIANGEAHHGAATRCLLLRLREPSRSALLTLCVTGIGGGLARAGAAA